MSTTRAGDVQPRLRFDPEAMDVAQQWVVVHRGIEYLGEVVVARSADAVWGQALTGQLSFRVVIHTAPRRIAARQIVDPRVVIAVPRRPVDPADSLARELTAVREARTRYVATYDPETVTLRSSMEQRETELLADLVRLHALSYSEGRIYTSVGTGLLPEEIFVGDSLEDWSDRMVVAMLEQSYPTLPLDHADLTQTLTDDALAEVFAGLFQGAREHKGIAAALGPPLGLSTREAPTAFDARACRVVQIIGRDLGANDGEMAAEDEVDALCRVRGLTTPLAALYLLGFVKQTNAEIELRSGHSVRHRDGGRFRGGSVGSDLVEETAYSSALADAFGTLRRTPALTWNSALPYTTAVAEDLRTAGRPADVAEQERLLLAALQELGLRLERSRTAVIGLLSEGEETAVALDGLDAVCSASGYQAFYTAAVNAFQGPSGLAEALDLLRRLDQLAELAPAITGASLYLRQMSTGPDHQELSMERDSLAARLAMDSLLADPSLWRSIEDATEGLRGRYGSVYRHHHVRYHEEAEETRYRLETARPYAEAIGRFSEVPELGESPKSDIPSQLDTMMASLRACSVPGDEISLDATPFCDVCGLPLSETVPKREAAVFLRDVELAMREYNRRLGSEGVRRVLADSSREQLDKFIDLVRVSDLSALANILDDEVVAFLRGFIKR